MGTAVAPLSTGGGPAPNFTPDIPPEWVDGPVTLPNSTPLVSTSTETPAAEGLEAEAVTGTATGLGLAGALAIGAGILTFLWPVSTAPAWLDELNPITGMGYRNKQEYEEVSRLSDDEIARRRATLAKAKLAKAKENANTAGEAPVCSAQQPCPLQSAASSAAQPGTAGSTQTQSTRKYADQTCEDEVREELQKQKNNACNQPRSCTDQKLDCAEILKRIAQNKACLAARQKMRDECFGGVGDQDHKDVMDGVQNVLDRCLIKAKAKGCS